jgi:hypothetical protein
MLYGLIYANDSDNAYIYTFSNVVQPPASIDIPASQYPLKSMVTAGSVKFYSSLSAYKAFLMDIENDDFIENKNLGRSLIELRACISIYRQILQTVQNLNYNEDVITKLYTFDYELTNVLFPEILKKVKDQWLKTGDITGFYRHSMQTMAAIAGKIESIEHELNAGNIAVDDIREVNQIFTYLEISGTYIAEVFQKI